MPLKPRPAVPTVRGAAAARNTSDVDVDQQLRSDKAGNNSHPGVPFPDIPLPEARPGCSVGVGWTSQYVAEELMVVTFGLWSDSCLVRFLCSNVSMWVINYSKCREGFGLHRVFFIYGFCIGCILFILLWGIAHAAFLQLLVCKEPPCDCVEAEWISEVSWKYRKHTLTPGCSGPALSFVTFYSVYCTPRLLLTMPQKTPFHWPKFSCRKMSTSNSCRLQHLTLHPLEHLEVTHQKNLTIRSIPCHIEPAQPHEFNAKIDSVKDMHAFPYLKHLENIKDSESEPPPPHLLHSEPYPGTSAPLSNYLAEPWERDTQVCHETNL